MGFAPTEPELSDSGEDSDSEALLQMVNEALRMTPEQAARAEARRLPDGIVARMVADHDRQRAETARGRAETERVLARAARVEEEVSARVAALLLQP